MKNIHVLPTDKQSRLYLHSDNELQLRTNIIRTSEDYLGSNQHIYITSDEEIKNDDWVYCQVLKKPVFICLDSILMFKNLGYDSNGNSKYKKEWLKKIILTTDQDLDGVQAIDDEFLEWFVKNPSCEEVEVKYDKDIFPYGVETSNGYGWYKIIIPKEKPEQETLEEVAHEMLVDYGIKSIGQSIGVLTVKKLMVNMAKWQAERIENESELLINELESLVKDNSLGESYRAGITASIWRMKEWFEQFKKK